jgi:hypothetical protein
MVEDRTSEAGARLIAVARVGLQPTQELEGHYLAGPYHPSLRHQVDSAIFFDMAASLIADHRSGREQFSGIQRYLYFQGQKNDNLLRLRTRFQLEEVSSRALILYQRIFNPSDGSGESHDSQNGSPI